LIVKLGVFSLWKGQQAFHSRPALISFTDGAMTLDSKVRARSSSSHEGERVIANHFGTPRPARKRAARNYPQVNSRLRHVNN
jgi:hypothetical protein